jgi:hypothetical protein
VEEKLSGRSGALQKAEEALEADNRPPVLYLRSFSHETKKYATRVHYSRIRKKLKILGKLLAAVFREKSNPGETERVLLEVMQSRGVYGPLTAQNVVDSWRSGRGRNYDQQLIIANLMNQIGPYIAIARPNDRSRWADLGAAKLEVPNEKWQMTVIDFIKKSAAIVVDAGNSDGLVWELKQVVELVNPIRLLLLLPLSEDVYANFRDRVRDIFPMPLPDKEPNSRLIIFSDRWVPVPLNNAGVSIDEMYTGPFSNILSVFFEQNGFELKNPR